MSWSPTNSTGFGFQGYLCSTACTKSGHVICSLQIAFVYLTSLAAAKIHEGEFSRQRFAVGGTSGLFLFENKTTAK
jgi:hypothetical protein